MVNDLDYEGIEFPASREAFDKFEKKNNICINVFCYENNLVYSVHISDKKFKTCMDVLMITDCNRSMSIGKNLTDLCAIRNSVKIKKTFASIVYNVVVGKEFWQNIKRFV